MTERSIEHAGFTIQRRYSAAPESSTIDLRLGSASAWKTTSSSGRCLSIYLSIVLAHEQAEAEHDDVAGRLCSGS